MSDINAAILDQAWQDHANRRLTRYDAIVRMVAGGVTWPEASGLLDAYTPPSEGYLVRSANCPQKTVVQAAVASATSTSAVRGRSATSAERGR